MPDIFFMFVLFGLLIAVWGFVLFLHIMEKATKMGKAAMIGAAMVYLVERFKK